MVMVRCVDLVLLYLGNIRILNMADDGRLMIDSLVNKIKTPENQNGWQRRFRVLTTAYNLNGVFY